MLRDPARRPITREVGDFLLRPAGRDDHAALCGLWREIDALHARLLPGYFRNTQGPSRSRAELERILRSPDESLVVAETLDGKHIAALVHAQIYDTPPQPTIVRRRRAHIDSLVVDEPHRRKGLATSLVDEVSWWARDQGAEEIVLTVWAGNQAAERLYARLGFGQVNAVLGKPL
jgi:ribosomal protein S18 acetylase RimI-like enzyme